jgi:hypothetical protein
MQVLNVLRFTTRLGISLGVFLTLLFSGCGGGGGGGTGPVSSTLSFPLQSGEIASTVRGSTKNFTVSGTCSGTASIASSTPIPATFEAVSGVSVANTEIINFTNCSPSINGTSTDYYDSNYVPLGTIVAGGNYSVFVTPPNIPVSVKVGDAGTIGTRNNYTDSTKIGIDGQDVFSYVVEPDTANTAIVNLIDKSYNSSAVLTSTEQDRYRIAADGTLTPVLDDLQFANGSTTHFVFTAIPDTAPPIVMTTNPPSNSTNVPAGASITATFSKAIDPVTITTAEFTLMNGTTPVSGAVTYSGTMATFTSAAPLTPNTLYTATITTGVKDLAGNPMSTNYSWTFTTEPLQGTVIASGIKFLPDSFNSANQLRASVVPKGGSLFFTDSSDLPLKKISLTNLSITPLASRIGTPENVAVQGQYVFWVDGGRLNETTLDGTVTKVLSSGQRDPVPGATADIVVDGTDVYWVNTVSSLSCSPTCTWIIQRVPLSGSAPVTLATTNSEIVALASDSNNIYWEERGIGPATSGCQCGSAVKKIPKSGGSVTTLVDGLLNGLLPPPPAGQTSGSWFPTGGIAVNGSEVFFANSGYNIYRVMEIPVSGGSITILASVPTTAAASYAQNSILGISVDATNVYWLDNGNSTLDEAPIIGGSVTTLASGLNAPVKLTVNASNAFWTEQAAASGCCIQMQAGQIREVSLAGGPASTLVSGIDAPVALAVDSTNIYWNEFWRIAKAPIGGGGPITTLASGISSDMARIAADQTNVYILDGDLIKKVPLNGGTVEKLSSAHGGSIGDFSAINQDIVTDGVNVYWTVGTVGPSPPVVQKVPVGGGSVVTLSNDASFVYPQDCYWRIAVDSQNVYWSTGSSTIPVNGCAIKKAPIIGGATTTVVDTAFGDFTVDGINIYFSASSSINKIPVSGGSISTVATNVVPSVLANDSLNLYWIDPSQSQPGGIGKVSEAGGNATFLVSKILKTDPLLAAEGIAVDQSSVYWTETIGGTIYKATPK